MIKYLLFTVCLGLTASSVMLINGQAPQYAPAAPATVAGPAIHATGIVEGATRDVQLRPEAAGRVAEVPVQTGQLVATGDVVLRLDDQRQRQLVEVSRASVELARAKLERLVNGARPAERQEAQALFAAKQAQLDQALRTWERVRELRNQSAVSQQEADEHESQVRSLTSEAIAAKARWEQIDAPARADEVREAQAGVAYAEAQLSLAEIELEKCQLRAPLAGCVLDVHAEPGELLRPEAPVAPVVLVDASRLRVRAFVEEIDAPRLEIGLPARITADGLPDDQFAGTIAWISPRMSPKEVRSGAADELYDTKVREVLVDVEAPSAASRLIVGLRVDVMFAGGEEASNPPSPMAAADAVNSTVAEDVP